MELSYATRTAFRSLYKEKWINLLSVITVAASLIVSAVAILLIYNFDIFTRALPEKFTMTVYMKDKIDQQDARKLEEMINSRGYVVGTKYISADQAFQELKRTLGNISNVFEGLEENPLSSAIEVRLKPEMVSAVSVKNISDDIRNMPGVDDVNYEEQIADTVHRIKTSVENLSVFILGIIVFIVLFVISSTVKILFYRRKNEIEIIKLLGATGGFIRKPFLIEGGVLGLLGGIFAVCGAIVFYYLTTEVFSAFMPVLHKMALPLEALAFVPVAGLLMGLAGSLISVGRLKI
jgi:cell division transport system permease protein